MFIDCKNWRKTDDPFLGRCKFKNTIYPYSYCVMVCKKCTNTKEELIEYMDKINFSQQKSKRPQYQQSKNWFRFTGAQYH